MSKSIVRDTFLPFTHPDLDETELGQIREALDSEWITSGTKTQQFESESVTVIGANHAIDFHSLVR